MPQLPTASQQGQSPFWELLSEAEEVQIREFDAAPANEGGSNSRLDELLAEMASSHQDGCHRAFLVRVKSRPAPGHPPVPPPEPSELKPILPDNSPLPLPDREHLLRNAALLVESGDHVLARHIYSYLIKMDARDIEALRGLGVCLFRSGDRVGARQALQASFDCSPDDENRYWLGQINAAEGDPAKAVVLFEQVADSSRLKPIERFQLYKEWGNCLARLGRWTQARETYEKALAIEPCSDAVLGNLGTIELECGSPEQALTYFNRALELNPSNHRARCGLGILALSRGDFDAAKRELEVAVEADPANPELQYALAVVELERGNWTACREQLKRLLDKQPGFERARRLLDEIQRNGGK